MFKLDTAEHHIEFGFSHKHFSKPMQIGGCEATDLTTATLLVDGKLYKGWAYCSIEDDFNKESGRKVSLKRALKTSRLTQVERSQVWTRYFNRGIPNDVYNGFMEGWEQTHALNPNPFFCEIGSIL